MEPEQKIGLLRLLKNLDLPREDGKTPLLLLDEVYDPRNSCPCWWRKAWM